MTHENEKDTNTPNAADPESRPRKGKLETYNTIAETVGGLPSLRLGDNLIQLIVIGVGTFLAVIVGAFINGLVGAAIFAAIGIIASTFISGFVLMILGWVRVFKPKNRR